MKTNIAVRCDFHCDKKCDCCIHIESFKSMLTADLAGADRLLTTVMDDFFTDQVIIKINRIKSFYFSVGGEWGSQYGFILSLF